MRSLTPFLISLALVGLCGPLSTELLCAGTPQPAAVATATQYAFSRELLSPELCKALQSQYSLEGELQVEVLSTLPRVAPAANPWRIEVLEFPSLVASIMQVRVRAVSTDREPFDLSLNLRVQVWREVWAAREPIAKDSPFDPSQLDLRRVDVLRERNVIPSSSADSTMMFRTQVAAGRLLQWRDIERRALVRKGDMVDVIASDGLLTVKMKALAMQNGAAGETITVRNMVSKRDISVQVTAENQAQVRF